MFLHCKGYVVIILGRKYFYDQDDFMNVYMPYCLHM